MYILEMRFENKDDLRVAAARAIIIDPSVTFTTSEETCRTCLSYNGPDEACERSELCDVSDTYWCEYYTKEK